MNRKKIIIIISIFILIIIDLIVFLFWFNSTPEKDIPTDNIPQNVLIERSIQRKEIFTNALQINKEENKKIDEYLNKINETYDKINFNESEQQKCRDYIQQMNDNQLLTELIINKNELLNKRQNEFNKYFSCRIDNINKFNRDDEVKDYIQQNNINKTFKDYLTSTDYKYKSTREILFLMLAFADIKTFCINKTPDYSYTIEDYCFDQYLNLNIKYPYICKDICKQISDLSNNQEYFNAIILNFYYFLEPKIKYKYIEDLKHWRIAIAHRIGGEEMVYKICDTFTGDDQKYCLDHVERRIKVLNEYKKYKDECNDLLNSVSDFICQ